MAPAYDCLGDLKTASFSQTLRIKTPASSRCDLASLGTHVAESTKLERLSITFTGSPLEHGAAVEMLRVAMTSKQLQDVSLLWEVPGSWEG